MTVPDGSTMRLADVSETTIGATPTNPTFQVMRYVTSGLKLSKQTDVPNEVRADRNVSTITDVGRTVAGPIKTLLSYGTFDTWLERLFCSSWTTNVLKNGITPKTATLENFYEQGSTDAFVRYTGVRFDTLDLDVTARQSVTADWGLKGIESPTPTTSILSGATYTSPTEAPVFNAALNVGSLVVGGITAPPKMQKLTMRINNNIYQNDVVGSYAPYGHGLGRFEVTGTMTTYFEDLYTYKAILDHSDVSLNFTLVDANAKSYTFSLPKVKLLDGGPDGPGNGQAVKLEVPFQAYYDADSAASLSITRSG